jgi:hypothetical protein
MKTTQASKLFALAIAAMIASMACIVVLADRADATSDHSIAMYVGDTFTYRPTTNLESTITPSGSACTTAYTNGSFNGFLTMSSGVITGTPTVAGTYSLTLTAIWSSGSLMQTATQTIDFTVHAHTIFTSSSSSYAIIGSEWNYIPAATGSGSITYSNPTIPTAINTWCIWDSTNNKFTGTPPSGATGTYTLSVTATAQSSGEAKTLTLTLGVFADLAIISETSVETYVGDEFTYDIETNLDDASGASIPKTAPLTNVPSVSDLSLSAGTISGVFSIAANNTSSPFYRTYDITVGASGNVSGTALTTTSVTVTIKVYSNLAFLNPPTASNVTAGSASADPLKLVLASDVEGATSIVYNWGDGTRTVITPDGAASANYSVAHTYATDGAYLVTISATNDNGTSNAYIMYDTTGEGSWSIADASAAGQDIYDQRGVLFLILGVVGAAALVAFVWIRNPLIAILGVILILAAIAVYLGEITPIKDLFGGS